MPLVLRTARICEIGAVRVAAAYVVAPGTATPSVSFKVKAFDDVVTALEKTALSGVETGTPLAPASGVVATTTGGASALGTKRTST